MAEPIVLEWLFPQAIETQWMLPPAGPGPVAAVFGPRGPQGPPGGTVIEATASGPVSGHRVVRAVEDGVSYASNTEAQDADAILGITVEAAASGAIIRIAASGEITDPSWSFAPGPVFVGVDGLLIQPVPTGATFIRQIAQALAPDRLLILNRPPIFS